jgi:hypothetical protein
MQKHLLVLLIAIATLVASVPCRAQIIAPPLAQKSLDVGVAYKWFDRDVTSGQLDEAKWEVATIYTRYGAWEWLTIGAEAGLWEIGARDEEYVPKRVVRITSTLHLTRCWVSDALLADLPSAARIVPS